MKGQFQNFLHPIEAEKIPVTISCFKSEVIDGRRRTSVVKFDAVLQNAEYDEIYNKYSGFNWDDKDAYATVAPIIVKLFADAGHAIYKRSPFKVVDAWVNADSNRIEFKINHMHFDKICMQLNIEIPIWSGSK